MPEGKIARPEGIKCPSAAILPEAIFNCVLTVEEYAFALSEGKRPKNCERAGKIVKEPGKVRETMRMIFFPSCVLMLLFSFMPCRERTCVK